MANIQKNIKKLFGDSYYSWFGVWINKFYSKYSVGIIRYYSWFDVWINKFYPKYSAGIICYYSLSVFEWIKPKGLLFKIFGGNNMLLFIVRSLDKFYPKYSAEIICSYSLSVFG